MLTAADSAALTVARRVRRVDVHGEYGAIPEHVITYTLAVFHALVNANDTARPVLWVSRDALCIQYFDDKCLELECFAADTTDIGALLSYSRADGLKAVFLERDDGSAVSPRDAAATIRALRQSTK